MPRRAPEPGETPRRPAGNRPPRKARRVDPTESAEREPHPNTLPALDPEVDVDMSASGGPSLPAVAEQPDGDAPAGRRSKGKKPTGRKPARRKPAARRDANGRSSDDDADDNTGDDGAPAVDPADVVRSTPDTRSETAGPITLFQQARDARNAVDAITDGPPATRSGQQVVLDSRVPRAGGYDRLILHDEELGRGGLGIVRAAEDRLLRRELAVKELHWSFDDRAVEAFIEEAQITGQLEHPNIVPVHELGFAPDGMPYLVMKRVVGRNLETIIDEADERTREAQREDPGEAARVGAREERYLLDIFDKMCDAVAYAHSRGVIHRDLKPANIMVGDYGEVLVVDWGLAKPLGRAVGQDPRASQQPQASQRPGGTAPSGTAGPDSSDKLVWSDRRQEHADQTIQGTVMGTPAYMPPEQARGRTADMDERTDIYSLGAVLYDMLTGQPPFAGDAEVVLDHVRTGRITPPSLKARGRHVPRELEAVVLKAMSYRRSDRYRSVAELKADIDAYRDGRALSAIDYSAWELVRKFAMRHRGPVFTALSAAAVLIAVIVWSMVSLNAERTEALAQRDRADTEADRAREAETRAREQATLAADEARRAEDAAERAAIEAENAERARAEAERERRDTARAFDAALAFRADHALKSNDVLAAMALLCETNSLRATITRFGIRPPPLTWHGRLEGHDQPVRCTALGPDGLLVASGSNEGAVCLWRSADGETVATLPGHEAPVVDVAFSPDGNRLASISIDGMVRLWDTRSYRAAGTIQIPGLFGIGFRMGTCVAFSPDGSELLTGGIGGVSVWDLSTQRAIAGFAEPFGDNPEELMQELMANPQKLQQMLGQMREMMDGRRRPGGADNQQLPFSTVFDIAFSPDGAQIATAESNGAVRLWDASRRTRLATLEGHLNMVAAAAFSTDGRLLATGSFDRTVRIWDTTTNEEIDRLQGHDDWVADVEWVRPADGRRRLLTVSQDRTARLWDVDEAREICRLPSSEGPLTRVDYCPQNNLVAISSEDRSIRLWHLSTGSAPDDVIGRHDDLVRAAAWSPDGRVLATGSTDRSVRLWDVVNRRSIGIGARHRSSVRSLAFSHDGHWLASSTLREPTVQIHDLDRGAPAMAPLTFSAGIGDIAFTPDGRYLIAGLVDGNVRLYDLAQGREETQLIGHSGAVTGVVTTTDGRWLVTTSQDRTARIWDLETHLEVGRLVGHSDTLTGVDVSPDGRYVATASFDGTVRIWDFERRMQLRQLDGHDGTVLSVDFSPDGRLLATSMITDVGSDGVTRVWDVRDGRELARLATFGASAFSPDGRLLATGTTSGAVRICGAAVPSDRDAVARITGLQRDGFDLRGISKNRERTLRQRWPDLPDVWNAPDPVRADFWAACWETVNAWDALDAASDGPPSPDDPAFGRALRPLQSWRERHPRHAMAEAASDVLAAARDGRDPRSVIHD